LEKEGKLKGKGLGGWKGRGWGKGLLCP